MRNIDLIREVTSATLVADKAAAPVIIEPEAIRTATCRAWGMAAR